MVPRISWLLAGAGAVLVSTSAAANLDLPSYTYGQPIRVECMNRSSETGEHIQNEANEIEWIPFPQCSETNAPLEFKYGVEGEQNCTIGMVSDPFFHLLEFYIHSDAPMACRLPATPPPIKNIGKEDAARGEAAQQGLSSTTGKAGTQEYIPLVFALAGTLQLSHLHISTHLNVLLHSSYQPEDDDDSSNKKKKKTRNLMDAGILDSGVAYSTSTLVHDTNTIKLVIGDPLPLRLSVRWFPTPALPHTEGTVQWSGMGGHVYASTFFYGLFAFGAGAVSAGAYLLGVVLPKRLKERGRGLGGATPLGYGIGTGGGKGIGNGWGISGQGGKGKRID